MASASVLFAVLLGFPAALKLTKGLHLTEGRASAADLGRVLAADAAIACASFGAAIALGTWLGRKRHGGVIHAVATTAYLFVILMLSALEHQAWVRSSTLLDWKIFWYTIQHYGELRAIIAAETTAGGVMLLVGAGVLAFAPAVAEGVARRLRRLGRRPRTGVAGATLGLFGALPFAWISLGAPTAPELHPLTRSAAAALIAGALQSVRETAADAGDSMLADRESAERRIERLLAAADLGPAPDGRPKNVLLVVLESTRFDATSVYVPKLGTTPTLERLSQPGVVVDRAYADMPHTSKALVSILCGYSPRLSVQISEAEPGGLPRPCLPHVLGELGYRRAYFQAATGTYENRHQFALNAGYEDVFTRESYDESGFEEINYLAVEDKVMRQPIRRWLDQHRERPFLLTVLTCISHHNYGLPGAFPLRQFARRPARRGGPMPRPWSDYNRYLNTVAYADQFVGELVEDLRARELLDETLIVVVGDHGQAFYEHGQKAHNTVIWDEALRVPLVLHNPKLIPTPQVIPGARRQVDIAPTVLSQLGVSFRQELFQGRDLLSAPEHEHVYSSCWYDARCMAETTGQIRVIDHFDHQPMEVFDLASDPFERRDLLRTGEPAERERWRAYADAARTRMRVHAREIEREYRRGPREDTGFVLDAAPRPQYPVRARLENSIELLGYDTATHEVTPDGFWEAVVYFRCIEPTEPGWRLSGTLRTVDGRRHQVDHHPAAGRLLLEDCEPGTYIADRVRVWIPGDFPPGKLRYFWGSVRLKGPGHVSRLNPRVEERAITPLARGVVVRKDKLLLATLQVQPRYKPELAALLREAVRTEPPAIDDPLEARFGDHLVLLEARVEPKRVRRTASLTLTTVWRVEGEQRGPWRLNVHFDSHRQGYWVRRAHAPVDGVHPIANWEPGTWVIDTHAIRVPEQMPRGEAEVWVGLRRGGGRMQVTEPGAARVSDRHVLAGTVEVLR